MKLFPSHSLAQLFLMYNDRVYRYGNMVSIFFDRGMYIMPDYILENNIEKLMITRYMKAAASSLLRKEKGEKDREQRKIMVFHTILFTK